MSWAWQNWWSPLFLPMGPSWQWWSEPVAQPCSSPAAAAVTLKWFYWSADSLSPACVPLLVAPPSHPRVELRSPLQLASLTWARLFLQWWMMILKLDETTVLVSRESGYSRRGSIFRLAKDTSPLNNHIFWILALCCFRCLYDLGKRDDVKVPFPSLRFGRQ